MSRPDGPNDQASEESVDAAETEDEWRFGLNDVGPEAEEVDDPRPPIEPQSPSLENVLFVTLGVLIALGLLFSVVNP